ncbi:hypothetical protein N7509_006463, partial [Penicillium cosmopolitanum]
VEKTVEHLSRNYYILSIYRKVRKYIKQYNIYQRNKPLQYTLYKIINAKTIVFLLFRYIFANYRIPQKIILDRDKLFIKQYLRHYIKHYYNQGYQEGPNFKKRKKVYLLRQNIKTKQLSSKLNYLKLGLFKIKEKIGLVNYHLKLPESIKKIYLTFYISLLEPVPENTLDTTNIKINKISKEEYKVKEIL